MGLGHIVPLVLIWTTVKFTQRAAHAAGAGHDHTASDKGPVEQRTVTR